MKISDHISYEEAVYSNTAERMEIDNIPSGMQKLRMINLAEKVFEPLRTYLGNYLDKF